MLANQVVKKLSLGAVCLSMLTACAQQPDKIQATYVSPNTYSSGTCTSLKMERAEIVAEVESLTVDQKKHADNDAIAMGVGLILFWPALFALALTDDQKAELSLAKGNMEAIDKTMAAKNC